MIIYFNCNYDIVKVVHLCDEAKHYYTDFISKFIFYGYYWTYFLRVSGSIFFGISGFIVLWVSIFSS
jgi:hypothetical protein